MKIIKVSSTLLFTILFAFSMQVGAKTPDGYTPAEEGVCDHYVGKQKGICIAYCEATDCGDYDQPHASDTACAVLAAKFYNDMGEYIRCGEVEPPPSCEVDEIEGQLVCLPEGCGEPIEVEGELVCVTLD